MGAPTPQNGAAEWVGVGLGPLLAMSFTDQVTLAKLVHQGLGQQLVRLASSAAVPRVVGCGSAQGGSVRGAPAICREEGSAHGSGTAVQAPRATGKSWKRVPRSHIPVRQTPASCQLTENESSIRQPKKPRATSPDPKPRGAARGLQVPECLGPPRDTYRELQSSRRCISARERPEDYQSHEAAQRPVRLCARPAPPPFVLPATPACPSRPRPPLRRRFRHPACGYLCRWRSVWRSPGYGRLRRGAA